MNINRVENNSSPSFNAKFKIKKTRAFKNPTEFFSENIAAKKHQWLSEADTIGNEKDTITITLGKNNIGNGLRKKQHMKACAKINGVTIENKDLDFSYFDTKSGYYIGYYEHLYDNIEEYLSFIKRVANAKISVK